MEAVFIKQSTIAKLESIVNYMNDTGWTKLVEDMSALEREGNQYLKEIQYEGYKVCPLQKMFIDLLVSRVNIAEIKYKGYCELVENANNLELLDSIALKNTETLQASEAEQNDIIFGISEIIFMLQDFQERILLVGNLPQNVPCDNRVFTENTEIAKTA